MPPRQTHRSQLSGLAFSEAAQFAPSRTISESRATSSYTSLDQALATSVPPRDSNSDLLIRPQPHESSNRRDSQPAMASDSRYYAQQQDPNAPYAYPTYTGYDPSQYSTNTAGRPIRNGAQHAHVAPPPPQPPQQAPQQYAPPPPQPPPTSYSQPGYGAPPSYAVAPAQQPAPPGWSPEGWSHYPQTYAPSAAPIQQQEPSYGSRPDAHQQQQQQQSAQPASEARAPSAASSSKPDNRRSDERAERAPEAPPQPKARKGKEPLAEVPASAPLPPAQLGLDYHKVSSTRMSPRNLLALIESYRFSYPHSTLLYCNHKKQNKQTKQRRRRIRCLGFFTPCPLPSTSTLSKTSTPNLLRPVLLENLVLMVCSVFLAYCHIARGIIPLHYRFLFRDRSRYWCGLAGGACGEYGADAADCSVRHAGIRFCCQAFG